MKQVIAVMIAHNEYKSDEDFEGVIIFEII